MKSPKTSPALLLALLFFGVDPAFAEDAANNEGKTDSKRMNHVHEGAAPRASARAGDPLPELTQQQLADFTAGLGVFEKVETVEGGLGPIFNNTSCAICHSAPAIGGGSAALVTRFGRMDNAQFDPLLAFGGSLLQHQAIDPGALERIPVEATIIAQRQAMPLFGAGLIEAIPDETIQALAQRKKADGVLGRVALVQDVTTGQMRVGRFGWKAQHATLLAMAADEFNNQMGITNRYFPTENAPNGDAEKLATFDHVADPEDIVNKTSGKGDVDRVVDFMRFLTPPNPPRLTNQVQNGFSVFNKIGCAECHVPILSSGSNKIRALDRKAVVLFSDLLLHDMGKLNDGIAQADALPNEMKTAPLWGLGSSAPYLHDGRAPTIVDAIRDHDGEGAVARDRFNDLNATQQRQLLEFLNSL